MSESERNERGERERGKSVALRREMWRKRESESVAGNLTTKVFNRISILADSFRSRVIWIC